MRKIYVLAVFLLFICVLSAGCASLWQDKEEERKELLPERNVKVIPFPVRPLEFEESKARQEKEQLFISGVVKNVSYSPVSNVGVRAIVFLAGDSGVLTLGAALSPAVLQPGETGQFSFTVPVEQPVSQIELHTDWSEYFPPGL